MNEIRYKKLNDNKIQIIKEDWMPGLWVGKEGIYLSSLPLSVDLIITAVDLDNRIIYLKGDFSDNINRIGSFDMKSILICVQSFLICECGKDKHGFARHSLWCSKYE